jgi:hypothetical protein
MQVIIDEIVSNVRALSRESVLAPETMRALVAAVLQAVRSERELEGRRRAELDLRGVAESHRRGER